MPMPSITTSSKTKPRALKPWPTVGEINGDHTRVIDIYEQPFAGIKTRSLDDISEPAIKETELPF